MRACVRASVRACVRACVVVVVVVVYSYQLVIVGATKPTNDLAMKLQSNLPRDYAKVFVITR